MKLRTSRGIVISTIAALMLGLLAACSSNNNQASQSLEVLAPSTAASSGAAQVKGLEDYTDELKITSYQGFSYGGPANGPTTEYAKYVKERFKINVDEFSWPSGEDGAKKLSLYAASGSMPDVILYSTDPVGAGLFNQMADAGMLLDIEPYLRNSPNVMKYLTETIIDAFRNPSDGKLYVLPGFVVNPDLQGELTVAVNNVFMVREDWLKQVNMEVPKTPDEFYELLKAFKALPPVNGNKVIPYLPLWEGAEISTHIGGMFGIWKYRMATDESAQRMVDYHEKPEYLEYLKYSAKLFREGLIYPETYKMEWQEAYNDILPKGYAGIANMWPSEIVNVNTALHAGTPEGNYVPFPLPKAPGVEGSGIERVNTLGASGIVVSKKTKDPERLFKYIDWQATNEGLATTNWGPPSKESGAWYIDESGRLIDNEQVFNEKVAENPKWQPDVQGGWAYALPGVMKYTQDLVLDQARAPEPIRALAKEQYAGETFMDTVYDIYMTSAPGPIRQAKSIDLDKIFKEKEAKIIITGKDDADVEQMYNAMMAEAEKAGFTDIMKEDYGRYMAVKEKFK